MAKPDFLVIGAQKAGTTWLNKMFKGHSDIWTPAVKEIQFFNDLYMHESFLWTKSHRQSHALKAIEHIFQYGVDDVWKAIKQNVLIGEPRDVSYEWYEKIFDFADSHKLKGEMTPEYSLLGESHVSEITAKYPDVKVIFVIRNPIERAVSAIKMRLLQEGFTSSNTQTEIDEFVVQASDDWDVVERGNYERIINLWQSKLHSGNFLVIDSTSFYNKPRESLNYIADFLSVSADKFSKNPAEKVHVGKSFKISDSALEKVAKCQEVNQRWYEKHSNEYTLT